MSVIMRKPPRESFQRWSLTTMPQELKMSGHWKRIDMHLRESGTSDAIDNPLLCKESSCAPSTILVLTPQGWIYLLSHLSWSSDLCTSICHCWDDKLPRVVQDISQAWVYTSVKVCCGLVMCLISQPLWMGLLYYWGLFFHSLLANCSIVQNTFPLSDLLHDMMTTWRKYHALLFLFFLTSCQYMGLGFCVLPGSVLEFWLMSLVWI